MTGRSRKLRVVASFPVGSPTGYPAGLALSPEAAWTPWERSQLLWRVDRVRLSR